MSKSMTQTLTAIIEIVRTKAEGLREEYCWFYLRAAYPGRSEQGLASLAKHVLGHTGR